MISCCYGSKSKFVHGVRGGFLWISTSTYLTKFKLLYKNGTACLLALTVFRINWPRYRSVILKHGSVSGSGFISGYFIRERKKSQKYSTMRVLIFSWLKSKSLMISFDYTFFNRPAIPCRIWIWSDDRIRINWPPGSRSLIYWPPGSSSVIRIDRYVDDRSVTNVYGSGTLAFYRLLR